MGPVPQPLVAEDCAGEHGPPQPPSRGGTGDPERTLKICELLSQDRHPAVEKALSWALRSLIRHDQDGVVEFLERHEAYLSPRVVREVRSKLKTGRKHGAARPPHPPPEVPE